MMKFPGKDNRRGQRAGVAPVTSRAGRFFPGRLPARGPEYAMRRVRLFARSLVTLLLAASAPMLASRPAPAQLVFLGEPEPPANVATSQGAVTMSYRVAEVFSGE